MTYLVDRNTGVVVHAITGVEVDTINLNSVVGLDVNEIPSGAVYIHVTRNSPLSPWYFTGDFN